MTKFTNRAFIFDMDGTLVNNMQFHTQAWQKMLVENGVEMDSREFLIKTAGRTNNEILPDIFGKISGEKILELGERKESLYRELFHQHRKTVEGVYGFLEKAQSVGVKMAVATSAPEKNVEFILDGLDLRRFFQAVITADDIKSGKPNPEIFLKSAEKLGVEPQNCLVFEDALNGFEAARRARMKAVAITTVNSREELEKQASVVEVIDDFRNLSPFELIEKHLPETARKGNE